MTDPHAARDATWEQHVKDEGLDDALVADDEYQSEHVGWNAAWAAREEEVEAVVVTLSECETWRNMQTEYIDRLREALRRIADEPEVDGKCPECVLVGYHLEWCSVGIAKAALGEHD